MRRISRRDFLKGAAASVAVVGLMGCGTPAATTTAAPETTKPLETKTPETTAAPETTEAPKKGGDGKYVTRALGHESWVYVATTLIEGKIIACEVLQHEETMGIGNYACARIPKAIVANQSVNVPNLRGTSITSMAIKNAVTEALELAGYDVAAFSKEITNEVVGGSVEEETDVVIMGGGCAGLVAACRLLEAGINVTVVEKRDIPGGSMAMTYGGFATAGSDLQFAYDVDGAYAKSTYGSLDAMMGFWKMMTKYHRVDAEGYDPNNLQMPFMTAQYATAGKVLDWMNSIGIGFNTIGYFEGATQYGYATPYMAPGCYEGGAGYAMMFLAQRIAMYNGEGKALGKVIYSTSVDKLLKDENGKFNGVHAVGTNGTEYTIKAKAVCLASGGFAKNAEMLKQYNPEYADFFFNCASASTGDGIKLGIEAGSFVECAGRALPAYLSSAKRKFELAFIHSTAPGIMVNINGDTFGNIISDNHYTMAKAKLNKDNGDVFYYVFDEASAVQLHDSESYGFNTYAAMFEKEEAVHYASVAEAAAACNLPNLQNAIDENNAAALAYLAGDAKAADKWGRTKCPYIDTRDGIWMIQVDPTFYLSTAGLAIDVDCHVLDKERKAIAGLYAAGDVCGSIEEKDFKQYGMGFDAALAYGYLMAETVKKEI